MQRKTVRSTALWWRGNRKTVAINWPKADEVYDFKDTHYNEREIEDFIDSVGRDLYEKLYPDFPFEKYVL